MRGPERRSQIFKLKNRTARNIVYNISHGAPFLSAYVNNPLNRKRERSVSGDSPRVCALSGPHVGGVTWAASNNFSSLGTHARTQSAKLQAPTTGEKGARRVCRPAGEGVGRRRRRLRRRRAGGGGQLCTRGQRGPESHQKAGSQRRKRRLILQGSTQ